MVIILLKYIQKERTKEHEKSNCFMHGSAFGAF